MCEEMKKLRTFLDENNIKWVDMSTGPVIDEYNLSITRTRFNHNGKRVSVINGYGTYGGSGLFVEGNPGLLEVMINGAEPIGWLICDDVARMVFE